MSTKEFPKSFIRGLASTDFVHDGLVLYTAFQFDDVGRQDCMEEASINWCDDDGAIDIALKQTKANGKRQFSAGVAKLDMETVKLCLKSIPPEVFEYERSEISGNPYHGNLLLSNSAIKPVRQMVMSGLALAAGTNIIPQSDCT